MKYIFILSYLFLISTSTLAQPYAVAQLEHSPRHHEWIKLKSNGRDLSCFVTYPESSKSALVILLIHENRGLNDWARSMADQLSEAGYVVVAPDLISGMSSEYEKTMDYPNSDQARTAIYGLKQSEVLNDLDAVFAYAENIPAGTGQVAVMGFCWGGSQTFTYATHNERLLAGLVFYGTGPKNESSYESITAPIYGFYGGADQRVNATLPSSEAAMKHYQKQYEYEVYEGAGHAYMRSGDDPNGSPENISARDQSWQLIKAILKP